MEKKAVILRIEKLSPQDGRGLRTVVFFKGCPLRCAWCSTPESQKLSPELYYQSAKCVRCGRCAAACPAGALTVTEMGVVRDRERCRSCFACTKACPSGAVAVYGKEMTVKEVMKYIHRDEVFYFHSGGGVTLSGGDVLCQADFAAALLRECRESGINTSAELDMYGAWKNVEKLLPGLDTFFTDIKVMDSEDHRKWTGVGNETILENIRKASQVCRKDAIHVRVPLIPGINDDKENIEATVDFCESLPNCPEIEFLPYHRLGFGTYEALGRPYLLRDIPAMSVQEAAGRLEFLRGRERNILIKISGRPFNVS